MKSDELSARLNDEGLHDLVVSMEKIERYVMEWWQQNYQPWFTDHGPAHSREVARYAFELASSPNITNPLTTIEYFILWSSSWLHDLGMQSLLGRLLGTLQDDDYAAIRHQHPDQSATEILEHAQEIGLPPQDTSLHQIIAYVARAHGTSYYKDSIEVLRRIGIVRGQTVRGPLLASIVLMADELHLDYQRSQPLVARALNNPISEAHALKHRVVVASQICHFEDGEIGFHITLQRNIGLERDVLNEIETWIRNKLQRQISMIESEFSKGFRNNARLSKAIKFEYQENMVRVKPPTQKVLNLVVLENTNAQLINHRDNLRDAISHARERKLVIITGRLDCFLDLDGREDLLSSVGAQLQLDGATVRRSIALRESHGGATCIDVLLQLAAHPHEEEAPVNDTVTVRTRATILDSLCDSVSQDPNQTAIIVSSVDALSPEDREWLLSIAIRRLMTLGDVSVVISCLPEMETVQTVANEVVRVSTDKMDFNDVTIFLARYSTWRAATDNARVEWTYADYKLLASKNMLGLEEDAWYAN